MQIGLFGGTFDPIHHGHLLLAERCRGDAGLDEVWFLPSYQPPHKHGPSITRFEHRCEMVTLATTGQPAFRVEPIEKELPPPSYTANTLAELRMRHPEHDFSLIVGADCLPDIPKWHDPPRLLELTSLIVVPRPGTPIWTATELATAEVDGQPRPLVWTYQKGPGRVFGSIPGHYTWTLDDPVYRLLALRGIAWVCGEPVSRLDSVE